MSVHRAPFASVRGESAGPGLPGDAQRIVSGAATHGGRLLSVSDIASAADVAEFIVRRHLPSLIASGYLRYTSHSRYFALGPAVHGLGSDEAA